MAGTHPEERVVARSRRMTALAHGDDAADTQAGKNGRWDGGEKRCKLFCHMQIGGFHLNI